MCKCGHNKEAHAFTDDSCMFSYNCDCKKYSPKGLSPQSKPRGPKACKHVTRPTHLGNICQKCGIEV